MDFRYDHIDETDLLDAIDRTETYLENFFVSQNVSQEDKNTTKNAQLSL
jgi:hypothetical protein